MCIRDRSKAGLVARGTQLAKDVTPYSITQLQRVGEFNPVGFVMPISRGMTPYNARKYFRQSILSQDKKLFMRTYDAALNNELDPDPIFKQAMSAIKSEKKFEAKLDARKIVNRFRALSKENRKKYLSELRENGEMTPIIELQVMKILKQKTAAQKKKRAYDKARKR